MQMHVLLFVVYDTRRYTVTVTVTVTLCMSRGHSSRRPRSLSLRFKVARWQ